MRIVVLLFCSLWTPWSGRKFTDWIMIDERSSLLSQRRLWRCSPITSRSGTMLVRVRSWTSSSRQDIKILPLLFGQQNAVGSLSDNEDSPTKPSPKKNRNKARRDRRKPLLAKAKAALSSSPAKKPTRDDRIPEKEWKVITGFKYSGKRRCPFFNSSLGCRFGDGCRNAHACVECGASHPYHGNHWAPWEQPPGCWLSPSVVSQSARMKPRILLGRQCLFRLLFGSHGLTCHQMFTRWPSGAPGAWRFSLELLVWLELFKQWVCSASHRLTSLCVRWSLNLLTWWMSIDGLSSCSWSTWGRFVMLTLAPHAIPTQLLAKMMEDLLHYALSTGLMGSHTLLETFLSQCFWATCSEIAPLRLVWFCHFWVLIFQSKTLWGVWFGLLLLLNLSWLLHGLFQLILINVLLVHPPWNQQEWWDPTKVWWQLCSESVLDAVALTDTLYWKGRFSANNLVGWFIVQNSHKCIHTQCAKQWLVQFVSYCRILYNIWFLRLSWSIPKVIAKGLSALR